MGRFCISSTRPGSKLSSYATMLEGLSPLRHVSACIDTGHVTIFAARRWMRARHPDLDVSSLDPADPVLGSLACDLDEAGSHAARALIALVARVARLGKPMHFHLHDGHLLSRLSPYRVCDHLAFVERIPASTALAPDGTLPTILGAEGLRGVLDAVHAHLPPDRISLTLEIHPTVRLTRKPLGERAAWFAHWSDLTHAELTHQWLANIADQAQLVRRQWRLLR